MRFAPVLVLVAAVGGCSPAPEPARTAAPAVSRRLGSWTGTGNTTLGFISESGSFRIAWKAVNPDGARPGAFQLTLRSGISGRPLKVIADH